MNRSRTSSAVAVVTMIGVSMLVSCGAPDGMAHTASTPPSTTQPRPQPTSTTPARSTPPTTARAADGPPTVDELLALGRPLVLAHTGGEDAYPGGTIYGFTESVRAGVDILDFNVLLAADGELVVQHDLTVDRTTNGTGDVASMTSAELAALDNAYWFTPTCGTCRDQPAADYVWRGVRTGERPAPPGYTADDFAIPTLAAVAERFPTIAFGIEIKDEGARADAVATALAEALIRLDRVDSTIVSSFDDGALATIQRLAPGVALSPGIEATTAWVLNRVPLPDGLTILQLPPEFGGLQLLTPELVADSTAAGYPIWVWPNDRTLENEASYRLFLDAGISGLNINQPVQGVAAVHRFIASGGVPLPPAT